MWILAKPTSWQSSKHALKTPQSRLLFHSYFTSQCKMSASSISLKNSRQFSFDFSKVSLVRSPNPHAFGLLKARRGPCLGFPIPITLSIINYYQHEHLLTSRRVLASTSFVARSTFFPTKCLTQPRLPHCKVHNSHGLAREKNRFACYDVS